MINKLKKYETIGCCGIDCGLCPRFYTKGDSACPGCGGLNFNEKHPSCGFLTCCVIKRGMEICSECNEYPCKRFDSERNGYDSFVTHKKIFPNLDDIINSGLDKFIGQQKIRMEILSYFLDNFDDGRSKSFFCLSCALLPVDKLLEIQKFFKDQSEIITLKEKNKQIRNLLTTTANNFNIKLLLTTK